MDRPAEAQASAARIKGPPELPTRATRRPAGSGTVASSPETSSSSSRVSTSTAPHPASMARTATSGVAAAAVCERAPRAPAVDLPAFNTTIGFSRPTLRAMRENLRGLPIDSR